MDILNKMCYYVLLRRHVPSGLAGYQVHQSGHRRWLWFAERYLISQIAPTPKQNHILKILGEF